jgi:hypothetical protein
MNLGSAGPLPPLRAAPTPAPEGTGVSLRVTASDAAGATVEQTLYNTYTP